MEKYKNKLRELGFSPEIEGYWYILDTVDYIKRNENTLPIFHQVNVFSYIAEKRGSTYSKVERAVRHSIERSYKNGYLSMYSVKPTMKRFLMDFLTGNI